MPVEAAGLSSTKKPNVRILKQSGHVGFDCLPDQLVNKSVESGFVFNVMCLGETGLGKSTLMDTLFNTKFEATDSSHTLANVKLRAHTYELQESTVLLKLTICDTLGFGDQINKRDSFRAVMDYLDVQFETYLQEELKIQRSLANFHDTRVHACLYFICPTGHGLKSVDLDTMKQLGSKVNIIPIIAKADSISKAELILFKERIMTELKRNDIKIYYFPTDDESVADTNSAMNAHIPFAVVGSTEFIKLGNKQIRARQYPWGTVQVENESHCDFVKLREMLIRVNMEDLREQTHVQHYELYRQKRLQEMGFCDIDNENNTVSFQQAFKVRRNHHLSALLAKEETVRQSFVQRVKGKEAELKRSECNLNLRYDKLKREHDEEKLKLDKARKKLDDDILEFATLKQHHAASLNCMTLTLGKSRKK